MEMLCGRLLPAPQAQLPVLGLLLSQEQARQQAETLLPLLLRQHSEQVWHLQRQQRWRRCWTGAVA
jgi:hypothetical protein